MRRGDLLEHRRPDRDRRRRVIWDAGRIRLEAVPGADAVLERHPGLAALFERPEQRIGLGLEGR